MRVFCRMIHRRYDPIVVMQRLLLVLLLMLMLVREAMAHLYSGRSDGYR